MSKRFSDTEKWKKPFIRSMEAPYKLLWLYILDDCDHAGIWQVDFEVAQIRIGETVTEKIALQLFGDRIEVFSDGTKWFLKDFISFQYGELSPKNRLHVAVDLTMQKHGLGRYKAPIRGQGQEQGQGNGQGQGNDDDFFESKENAFKEISSNYLEVDPARNILANLGWRSVTDADVKALLFHFLDSQVNLSKQDKADVKLHFRRWLNKQQIDEMMKLVVTIKARYERKQQAQIS